MIHGFTLRNGRLVLAELQGEILPQDLLWIDLSEPDKAECRRVEESFHQQMAPEETLEEIEATTRFRVDPSGLHIHSYFLDDAKLAFTSDESAELPRLETVSFTINQGRLFTIHEEELATFRMLRLRARQGLLRYDNAEAILLGLMETKVDQLADLIERLYEHLEEASHEVFESSEQEMQAIISSITRLEDLNGKIRLSLLDTQRAMQFLLRHGQPEPEHRNTIKDIQRDVESLTPHTGYIFEKINFLLDAATGIINVEQNRIIKAMTLASVVFLPPTLIASIYGMNFEHMPELSWPWGYPVAVGVMIISTIAPYAFFKWRGWL